MVETREMAPTKRNALPEWEVKLDGKVIGYIRQEHLRGSSRPFFDAVGLLPSGEEVRLELSTDFDERLKVVEAFHHNPLSARQHLPRSIRQSLEGV